MSLTKITGVVSGLQVNSSVSVSTTVANNVPSTTATTSTTTSFRIDNRPAHMKVQVNLSNGDNITAAGIQKGEMEVMALNNHTTKTMYWVPEPHPAVYWICGFFILFGVLTLTIVIGIFMLGAGGYTLMKSLKKKKLINEAKAMVA